MRPPETVIYRTLAVLLIVAAFASFGAVSIVHADTITVTGTDDALANDGVCTLREAVIAANDDLASGDEDGECPAGNGADTIILASNTLYELDLALGTLTIDSEIVIEGNDATIARHTARIFRVITVIAGGNLTLNDLTVRGGFTGSGAGIANEGGVVTIVNSTITLNGTLNDFPDGGGIRNRENSVMTIIDSTISENATRSFGGGILNDGEMTIEGSTIAGNQARDDGAGGIHNSSTGVLTIIDSVISGNDTNSDGGGIHNDGGTVTITNTTIVDNDSAGFGGGISNENGTAKVIDSIIRDNMAVSEGGGIFYDGGDEGSLEIIDSTIHDNQAGDAINDGSGGGVFVASGSTTITGSTISENNAISGVGGVNINDGTTKITNTTVSGNALGGLSNVNGVVNIAHATVIDNPGGAGISNDAGTLTLVGTLVAHHTSETSSDCSGNITSNGFNVDSDGTCGLDDNTDMPMTFPFIDALGDNGGPTETHALGNHSPLINAVPTEQCDDANGDPLTTDQRGVARPQGVGCDIGAYEVQPLIVGDLDCDGILSIIDAIVILRLVILMPSSINVCAGL